jgi:hypothetical protein
MAPRSSMALSVQISLKSTPPAFFWLPRWKPAFRPEYILFGLAERRKEGDLIRNSLLINIIRKTLYRLENRLLHRRGCKIARFGCHRKASFVAQRQSSPAGHDGREVFMSVSEMAGWSRSRTAAGWVERLVRAHSVSVKCILLRSRPYLRNFSSVEGDVASGSIPIW